MTVRLVTDSTCDLTADLMHAYCVSVVPIHIRFGTEHYVATSVAVHFGPGTVELVSYKA